MNDSVDEIAELLGREPAGDYEIVVRDDTGAPLVIRNAPLLHDGTPMPTLYWLVGTAVQRKVSQLESRGGVRQAEAEVDPDALARTHAAYARERDALIDPSYTGPVPSGGVGGTRKGVKCLHAHYAYYLARGEDPVGAWVEAHL